MDRRTNFEIGSLYAVNGSVLRGHFLCLLEINGLILRFVDTLDGKIYDIEQRNVKNALKHIVGHPKYDNLTFLDFVDKLPSDVFECLLANIKVDTVERITLL